VQVAVGAEQRHRLRGDEMAGGRDERLADGQRIAVGERLRERRTAANAVERIRDQARHVGPLDADLRDQRVAVRVRLQAEIARFLRADVVEREARGRRGIGGFELERPIQRRKLDRLEPLAQHRLERVVPAGVDVERRVEVRGAAEPDAREPFVAVLAVADLGLERRERLRARFEIGQRAAFALPRLARFADARLRGGDGRLQRVDRRLLLREVGVLLRELRLDVADRIVVAARQRGDLGREARLALAQLRGHVRDVVATRLRDAHVLLDVADALLDRVEPGGRLGERLLERGDRRLRFALVLGHALARGQRHLERRVERCAVGVERGRLALEAGELRRELGDLLAMRLSESRAKASCCSRRVTSALAA
jgi:hypothetical protein